MGRPTSSDVDDQRLVKREVFRGRSNVKSSSFIRPIKPRMAMPALGYEKRGLIAVAFYPRAGLAIRGPFLIGAQS